MSSIKPPGGPKGPSIPDATQSPTAGARGFDDALEGAKGSGAVGASGQLERTSASPAVRTLDAASAIDTLVAEALASPMAASLDAAGRAELEQHLRSTLADDPNLQQLVKDLERA